jgi:iron complex transport system substrate-binding protein
MKRLVIFLFVALCATLVNAQAIEVKDDRGQLTRFERSPQRIVSVLPSLTESVCALGACARLVGVDRYSNWPASVKKLPQVGGGLDLNIEAIVRLQPNVVLAATSSRAGERLRALGIPVLLFEPQSHADVRRVLMALDALLGTGQGDALLRKMDESMQQAAQSLPASAADKRVYFEVDRTPYAAGQASFIGQTLTRLGLKNIIGAQLGAFPKINPEYVVQQQPDVIILSQRHAAELPKRPGWKQLKALQNKQVCELTPEQGDLVVRSGPRMAEGAQVIAQCLRNLHKK